MVSYVARIGYACLALLVLQVLSLVTIALLQYAVFDHIQLPEQTAISANGDHLLYIYGTPLDIIQPDRENVWVVAVLWLTLAVVVFLIIIYLSNISSALLKRTLKGLYGKTTLANLFAAKFILPGISYVIVSLLAILLPAVYVLLPVDAMVAFVCLLCFGVQYRYVHRHKISLSKVL